MTNMKQRLSATVARAVAIWNMPAEIEAQRKRVTEALNASSDAQSTADDAKEEIEKIDLDDIEHRLGKAEDKVDDAVGKLDEVDFDDFVTKSDLNALDSRVEELEEIEKRVEALENVDVMLGIEALTEAQMQDLAKRVAAVLTATTGKPIVVGDRGLLLRGPSQEEVLALVNQALTKAGSRHIVGTKDGAIVAFDAMSSDDVTEDILTLLGMGEVPAAASLHNEGGSDR